MSWWTITVVFALTVVFSIFGARPMARLHWYFLGNWYGDDEEEREKERRAFRLYLLAMRATPLWFAIFVLLERLFRAAVR